MSGRPPPPLPPKAAAPSLTSSTASKRVTRSSVTPRISAASNSPRATNATMPEPRSRFIASTRLFSSLAGTPSSARAANLTPPKSLAPPPWSWRGPPSLDPASAAARRASDKSRSSFLRSSKSAASRAGNSPDAVLSRGCRLAQQVFLAGDEAFRRGAGQRLDAPHARGDRAFGGYLEEADIDGPRHMRAAAKLDREMLGRRALRIFVFTHRHDAHLVAVFLAEQRQGAFLHRQIGRHQPRAHLGVLADAGIDLAFDRRHIVGRERLGLREIEAQALGRHERALLRDMLAEAPAQRLMQQMRDRMIGAQAVAPAPRRA